MAKVYEEIILMCDEKIIKINFKQKRWKKTSSAAVGISDIFKVYKLYKSLFISKL